MTTPSTDTTTTTTTPVQAAASLPAGSPERAAAMADLYNGRHDGQTAGPDAPEGIPAKFWNKETGAVNVEALLASYKALEGKLGQKAPTTAETPATTATTPAATTEAAATTTTTTPTKLEIPEGTPAPEAVAKVVEAAGLDAAQLQAQIVKTGKLDDASVDALTKQGVPKALIDAHVETVKELVRVQQEANAAAAVTYAGGEQSLNAMIAWAGQNLQADEKTRLNTMLASADWKMGLDVLKARFGAASKTAGEPGLLQGNNSAPPPAGYRSRQDWIRDIQNPDYKKSPAFRAQVLQRYSASQFDLDK